MKLTLPKLNMWWVVAAGIVVALLLSVDEEGSNAEDATSGCRFSVTADALNIRSGPSADKPMVGQLERGAKTNAEPVVENGFRKLSGGRWVSAQYLAPEPGNTCR